MASQEIPGPTWHEGLSHGLRYDHERHLVHVYVVIGEHRLNSTVRPMCEEEVIHSKLRGHDPEVVRKAYGFTLQPTQPTQPVKQRPWWRFW